ncbi:MAG: outer membrane lipoprotein-sorting protein [Spirochaetes bacterium]|nr:outer membrane lipoprotein-sorting protein [Spirochaetota bacterium]
MKIKIFLFLIFPLIISSITFTKSSHALTGKEIIEKSEKATRGDTSRALYEITIKTRRWTRTLKLEAYENRKEKKSFSIIHAPKKDSGNRFLLIDQNMWHYIPDIQQTIKISPSMMLDSWMGSDFSNDDIVKESSILKDYTHKLIGNEAIDGFQCYNIELLPKPDAAVVWGKIIYYARQSDCLPVKEEFYNEHNVLKKIMTCSEFKKMHNRIIPTVYTMKTVSKKDQYTRMKIEKIMFNIPINSKIFSKQNLAGR